MFARLPIDSVLLRCARRLTTCILIAVLGIGAAGCTDRPDGDDASDGPPNIVFLFADDMGYGDLSSYGQPQIRTPRLTELEREGTRLTNFYTGPWCVPSRYQVMTGRYLGRGDLGGTGANGDGGIADAEVTLPERLSEAGYYTQMIGKWHLGHAEDRFLPHHNGFDDWYGLPYSNDYMPPWVQTDVPLNLYHNDEVVEHPVVQDSLTVRYTDRAVDLIESGENRPFFLYLAYNMPHLPVRTTDEFRGRSDGGLYGDVIETIDWSVGRVLDALEREGLAENTIVVFASDNGPWLDLPPRMRQAGNERWHAGSPGLLRGWKGTTYEGGVRVPAMIRWPGEIPADRQATEPVALMDLYASFLQAAGTALPSDRIVDGQNLLPYFRGEADEGREVYYYAQGEDVRAVRSGPWKLRVPPGSFETPNSRRNLRLPADDLPEVQLFHLVRDPSERWNVADAHPELVDSLRSMIATHEETLARSGPER